MGDCTYNDPTQDWLQVNVTHPGKLADKEIIFHLKASIDKIDITIELLLSFPPLH